MTEALKTIVNMCALCCSVGGILICCVNRNTPTKANLPSICSRTEGFATDICHVFGKTFWSDHNFFQFRFHVASSSAKKNKAQFCAIAPCISKCNGRFFIFPPSPEHHMKTLAAPWIHLHPMDKFLFLPSGLHFRCSSCHQQLFRRLPEIPTLFHWRRRMILVSRSGQHVPEIADGDKKVRATFCSAFIAAPNVFSRQITNLVNSHECLLCITSQQSVGSLINTCFCGGFDIPCTPPGHNNGTTSTWTPMGVRNIKHPSPNFKTQVTMKIVGTPMATTSGGAPLKTT